MKLIDKIKRVLFADNLYWHNAESVANLSLDRMQRALIAGRMSSYQWECYIALTKMDYRDIVKAAWLLGYFSEGETPEDTEKRNGFIHNYCKKHLAEKGYKVYYPGSEKAAKMEVAIDVMKEDNWINAVLPMMKEGYLISIPNAIKMQHSDKLRNISRWRKQMAIEHLQKREQ